MAINQEAFNYIKEKFITKQQASDYYEEIALILRNGKSNINPNAGLTQIYTIWVGPKPGTIGVWTGIQLPSGAYIAPADFNDIAWRNAAIRAIKAQDTRAGTGENPIDYIISILKKFDKNIPTKNINLTDIAYAKAFENWYSSNYSKSDSCWHYMESALIMASFIAERIKNFNIGSNNPEETPETSEDVQEPPAVEEDLLGPNIERQLALEEFIKRGAAITGNGFDYSEITYSSVAQYYESLLRRNNVSVTNDKALQNNYVNQFIAIASPTLDINKLSDSYQKSLYDKIEASGLFDLLSHVDAMQAYGRARLSSLERVKGSGGAANVLDGVRDTAWLQQLTVVLQTLSRDPVTLATIYRYFPELVNFFFAALAATGDYSNEGKGGGKEDPLNDAQAVLNDLMSALGQENGQNIFTGAWDLINTGQRIEKAIAEFPWRQNIPPISPDIFHLRLGAANFYIPPIGIDVQTQFKVSSLSEGALRQKNSPKFNSGYKHTTINLQLFFPNYEEIWGISIKDASKISIKDNFTIDFSGNGDNEEKIDKFLSSLRGLVAAFKYAPFLPIRNQYLNSVYGITGVSLKGMSISTIPSYPFALVVTLNLYHFNHKPFLPMINDFNQAIHWGKFRQYMGKAAGALHNYINEEFLMVTKDSETYQDEAESVLNTDRKGEVTEDGLMAYTDSSLSQDNYSPDKISNNSLLGYKNEVFTTNVVREWINGSNITFYMPAETQTKIFTPDISGFRSEEEKGISDLGRGIWNKMLANFGIDINESAGYHRSLDSVITTSVGNIVEYTVSQKILQSIDILTAGRNTKDFQKKRMLF